MTAATIPALLVAQATLRPNHCAVIDPEGPTLTYSELDRITERLAWSISALLRARNERPPRIGLALPNGAGLSIAMLAAARTGAVAPLNPASTEREFTAAIQHAKLDLVIVATGQDCAAVPAA
ncbi:MAG: AMP-binding protein, partial [Shimia sp.]